MSGGGGGGGGGGPDTTNDLLIHCTGMHIHVVYAAMRTGHVSASVVAVDDCLQCVAGRVFRAAICASPVAFLTPAAAPFPALTITLCLSKLFATATSASREFLKR